MGRAVGLSQVLDGEKALTIESREEKDTGIDGFIFPAVAGRFPDQNGAGTAVAFGAPFFRSGQSLSSAQIFQDRDSRFDIADFFRTIAEYELDGCAHPVSAENIGSFVAPRRGLCS